MMKSDQHSRALDQLEPLKNSFERRGKRLITKCSIAVLTACVVLPIAASNRADAQVIFESANLGDSNTFGAEVSNDQFDGVRFHLDSTAHVTHVGGNMSSTGSLFIAIADATTLPVGTGNPFADPPLAVTTFVAGSPSSDVRVPLQVTLSPGDYVLVVGAGLFGATGTGNVPTKFHGQTAYPNITYHIWNVGSGWLDASPTSGVQGMRFVIEGELETNSPPTADAGSDQSIRDGDTVVLDGSASFDDDTLPESLLYFWSFASKPAGSNAVLDDPTAAMPSFVADVNGTYSVQLVVADEAGAVSDPAFVTISSDNLAPVAVADSLFTLAIVGEAFLLDGTASSDPENDPIAYDWVLVSAPTGSLTTLVDASTSTPSFTPDVEGEYLVLLQVSDLIGPGEPVLLEITATSNEEFAEVVIVDTADQVDFLSDTQVTTQGNQEAFGNLLSGATKNIQKGNESQAIDKLLKAIERVDGCALRGAPDGNGPGMDWVTDCEEQLAIYDSLIAALNALSP